jgi:hypothetical protein
MRYMEIWRYGDSWRVGGCYREGDSWRVGGCYREGDI